MPNPYFPFHALGYQCNPFRAVTDEEWVALAILPASIQSALTNPYLQVLGEKGHGKTTTLLALTHHFKQKGLRAAYEHLEVEADHFSTPLAGLDVLLLDETQRLTAGERHRLLASGLGQLVLAGHEDLTPLFNRFGLSLTTIYYDQVVSGHLAAVVNRRLAYFALPGAPVRVTIAAQAIAYLEATFGADIRRSEQTLYEAFELVKGREDTTEVGLDVIIKIAPKGL